VSTLPFSLTSLHSSIIVLLPSYSQHSIPTPKKNVRAFCCLQSTILASSQLLLSQADNLQQLDLASDGTPLVSWTVTRLHKE
jgi:choline-glycine betaine transporter